MAKDDHLSWLANEIAAIPHIKRLRIHSRLPVVLPERISHDFVEWFTALPLQKVLVLHANHANEMSETLKSRLNTLRERGVILLNQSVLLKGVNDSGDAISDLSELEIIPPIEGLPEGLSKQAFTEQYQRVDSEAYLKEVQEIKRRIALLPLYQK